MQHLSGPRRFRYLVVAVVAAMAAVAVPAPAYAAQHQNANIYTHWNFSGASIGYWNVDQQMRVEAKATATYWSLFWRWTTSSDGGYMGLQTNGSRFDGSTGETAIFSLWNATAASGPSCRSFGGEGTGYSCRLAYTFSTNRFYRYRVWILNKDSVGQWWGAWIQDTTTGVDTYIGSIRVAATRTRITGVMNFVEYFGTAVACGSVPRSQALWTQPAANHLGNGVYEYGSTFSGQTLGACTDGGTTSVDLGWTKAARVVLGG